MKDKLLFYLDADFTHFALAYFLQQKYDCEIYAIIDITNKPKEFFLKQKLVNFKKIWFVHDDIKNNSKVSDEILQPLYDDLNTPGYIANLHKLYEGANKGKDKDLFISACKFIGLFNENKEQWENYKMNKASISEAEINDKIDLRNKAREDKNYKEADRIRDELFDKGVLIEDKDGKTLWKFK